MLLKSNIKNITIPKTKGKILYDMKLSHLTWFKVGGKTDLFFQPRDLNDLRIFLSHIDNEIPIYVLGAGSNTLFRDAGFNGIVIKLGRGFDFIKSLDKKTISVGAATNCIKLARTLAKNGMSGLEFFSGIPGTIGGAIRMNSGAYGKETSDALIEIMIMTKKGDIKNISPNDYYMGYRETEFPRDYIFISAKFLHGKNYVVDNLEKLKQLNKERKNSQPIKEKTGGSTFKNPKGFKAWELIENSGCKNFKVGDATLSKMHSNFLVNNGEATSSNLEELGEKIIKRVYQRSGIKLIWEIRIVGKKIKEHN